MDGFAVHAKNLSDASPEHPVTLSVLKTVRAGHPIWSAFPDGSCYKIMTGAPVPPSADAVVPVEWTRPGATPGTVDILRSPEPQQHLRLKGEDMRQGAAILNAGSVVTAPMVGVLATVGAHQVTIRRPPRVAILSTGDELVDPADPLAPGKIRNSNSHALFAAVLEAGGEPTLYPAAPDDPAQIHHLFKAAAGQSDLLISSGGVSVGDYDFVKPVIESLGELTLWRVNLKPGKPLAFGRVLGVPILGLPGNPVSALITFELFVRPVIRTMLGDRRWQRPVVRLPLLEDFTQVEDRRHYVRSRVIVQDGRLLLIPHKNQGSAVQSSWQDVDALTIVPEHTGPHPAGTELSAMLLSVQHVFQR
jgi:molybdopterin molybdotransferase